MFENLFKTPGRGNMKKFYKCEICGNFFSVFEDSGIIPMCCGDDMTEVKENTTDGATEKHVPVIERNGSSVKVKIGSVSHPMEAAHYIQWIIVEQANKTQRLVLNAGDAPEAEFTLDAPSEPVTAYEYCNLHGLWSAKG
jgi:superoxide reductase